MCVVFVVRVCTYVSLSIFLATVQHQAQHDVQSSFVPLLHGAILSIELHSIETNRKIDRTVLV